MSRRPAAPRERFLWLVLLIICGSSALAQSPLLITSSKLPDGYEGDAYSATLTATGGMPPYVWSLRASTYPGLSLSPAGVLSGVPTTWASGSFVVRVADAAGTIRDGEVWLLIKERVRVWPACYPTWVLQSCSAKPHKTHLLVLTCFRVNSR